MFTAPDDSLNTASNWNWKLKLKIEEWIKYNMKKRAYEQDAYHPLSDLQWRPMSAGGGAICIEANKLTSLVTVFASIL